MNTFSILSFIVSALMLLIAYFTYKRNKPKLSIIQLYQSSASTFSGFIDKIKFSYKDNVFENISASELIISNSGYRAIEKEDIRIEDPLEIYTENSVNINEITIIKKHGSSNVELNQIDNNTIRINIISFDKGSSIRIKLLCNGENPKFFARGKIINADKSISNIKNLKSVNIKESISDFFLSSRKLFKVSFIFGLIMFAIIPIIEKIDLKPKAIIFAPKEFYNQSKQLFIVDSLIDYTPKNAILNIVSVTNDTLHDSLFLERIHTHVSINWGYQRDSIAMSIHDSLEVLGYDVSYYWGQSDKYQEYQTQINKYLNTEYEIRIKQISIYDYKDSIILGGIIGFIMFCFMNCVFIFAEYKSIIHFWKYRYFLSCEEIKEIRNEHSKYLLSMPFLLFFPKNMDEL